MSSDIQAPRRTWLGDPWKQTSWWAPVCVSVGLLVAVGPIHVSGRFGYEIMWWHMLIAAPFIMFAALCSIAGRRYDSGMQLYILLASLLTSVWLVWVTYDFVWRNALPRGITLCLWLGLTVVATARWHGVRQDQIDHEDRLHREALLAVQAKHPAAPAPLVVPQPPPAPPPDPDKVHWEGIFVDLLSLETAKGPSRPGPKFHELKMAEGGPVVDMELPGNGRISFDDVSKLCHAIELRMDLPPGTVTMERKMVDRKGRDGKVSRQPSSRRFLIHVNELNILAEQLLMRDFVNDKPRSILEAFPIGKYQDGQIRYMTVYEIHWLIVAETRRGKSNLVDVMVIWLSRCTDCEIWFGDFKMAATVFLHLAPFVDRAVHPKTGQPVPPIIGWPFIHRFETERALRAGLAVIKDRPLRRAGKGNKHIPTREDPVIVIILEEVSEILGSNSGPVHSYAGQGLTAAEFGAIETDITKLGAGEGVLLVKTVQRNSVTMAGPGDSDGNYVGRVGLGASDMTDARMIFPKGGDKDMAPLVAALQEKGTLLITQGSPEDRMLPVKAFFTGDGPEKVKFLYDCAFAASQIVPGGIRNPHTRAAVDRWGYSDLWTDRERIGWLYGDVIPDYDGKPIDRRAPKPVEVKPADASTVIGDGPAAAYLAELEAGKRKRPQGGDAVPSQPVRHDWLYGVDVDEEWVRQLAAEGEQLDGGAEAPDDGEPVEESNVDRVVKVAASFEAKGCTWTQLVEAMAAAGYLDPKNKSQLRRWVLRAIEEDRMHQPAGRGGRYYATTEALPKAA